MRIRDRIATAWRIIRGQASAGDAERIASGGGRGGGLLLGGLADADGALSSATVYGAVRLIASALAQMPLEVRDSRRPGDRPNDHPVERVWNVRPNPRFTGPQLVEWVVKNLIVYGDAHVLIDRGPRGGLRSLWPLRPGNVIPIVSQSGRLTYQISQTGLDPSDGLSPPPGTPPAVDQDRMLHFSALDYDGRCGRSPVATGLRRAAATDIAMSMHTQATYSRGALQQYALMTSRQLTPEQQRDVRAAWEETYARGPDSAGAPIVLGGDLEIRALQSSAREQQMAESRDFQISDVLRGLGVPGILMNQENKSTSWGTGIQETKAGFLAFTLQEYVRRIEGEINAKLFNFTSEYAILRSERLLRGTVKERYASHAAALGGGQNPGWKSVNEIRVEEGLTPLDDPVYDAPYHPGSPAAGESDDGGDEGTPDAAPPPRSEPGRPRS